jgi:hypothetical protein
MQKLIICLEKPEQQDRSQWNKDIADFVNTQRERFYSAAYSVADDEVAPAHLLVMHNTAHPKDALISIWVNNPYDIADVLQAIQGLGRTQAYAVLESAAIPNHFKAGRVEGMCQVALLKKPPTQSREDWLQAWLGEHTRVAIDTQSNFAYRQNVVAYALPFDTTQATPEWPLMDAIVEENFPAIAMTSREAFFDSEGDSEKFESHQQIMMQSCFKFIDFEAFDCTPMSQYVVKEAAT